MPEGRIGQVFRSIKAIHMFVLRDMWTMDVSGRRRYGWAVRVLKMSFLVYKNLREKRFFLRAHALTYWTLISIVPALAVMVIVLKSFGADLADRVFWPRVEQLLAPATATLEGHKQEGEPKPQPGPTAAKPDAEPDAKPATAGQEGGGVKAQGGAPAQPDYNAQLIVKNIKGYVDRFVNKINTPAVGMAGVTIALLTVISLLTKIEQGFNDIWDIRRKRTLLNRIVVYWAVVSFPGLLLVISSGMNIISKIEGIIEHLRGLPFIGVGVRLLLPYFFVWTAFTLLYTIMPNARVRLRSAIVAAVVAGTLWQVANQTYVFYIAWTSKKLALYRVIYGPLADVPIFLMWVYLSWAIVLFGAGVAYADQNLSVFEREGIALRASFATRQFVALRTCIAVGQAFHYHKEPLTPRTIAVGLRLPVRIVSDSIKELLQLEYIVEVINESGVEEDAYMPATSLENSRLADLAERLHTRGGRGFAMPDDAATTFLRDLIQRGDEASACELGDVTLLDVVMQTGPFISASESEALEAEAETAALNGRDEDEEEKENTAGHDKDAPAATG